MKLSSIFLILLLPAVAYSQTNDYRLDSYVNPDYKRKELDFLFGTSTRLASQKTKQKTSGTDTYNSDMKYKNFSGDISGQFYQIENSIKKQTYTNLYIDIEGDYFNNSSGSNSSNIKNKHFTFNMNYFQEGYYYGKDKKFIEFSPYAYFNHATSINDYENSVSSKSKSTTANILFKFGIGKGRIEQVEDAYLSMYILSDLMNNGSLDKTLSPDEVNMLAQQITSIKNKRQFDSRVKLIEEISTVDSFLTVNGYINAKTAPYFTSLYDNWMYAGLFERTAGSRISIGVSPDYKWNYDKQQHEPVSNNDYRNYYSETKASAYISYRYEKPVNLYLQHSVYTNIEGEWINKRGEEKNTIGPRVYGEYSFGYYPNTRTHIRSSLFSNYFSAHNDDISYHVLYNGLRMNLYYYLSPQLRLNADGGFYFLYSNNNYKLQNQTNTNNSPDFSFNIGLRYSIF